MASGVPLPAWPLPAPPVDPKPCHCRPPSPPQPGHGNIGPLAVGYTLFASAFIGGPLTGAALNPARVLGPALIYGCYWNTAFVYIAAEFLGGAIAAVLAMILSVGRGGAGRGRRGKGRRPGARRSPAVAAMRAHTQAIQGKSEPGLSPHCRRCRHHQPAGTAPAPSTAARTRPRRCARCSW